MIRAHGAVFAALTRPFTQFSRSVDAVGVRRLSYLYFRLRNADTYKHSRDRFTSLFSHARKMLQLKTSNDTNRIVDLVFSDFSFTLLSSRAKLYLLNRLLLLARLIVCFVVLF